MESSSSADPTHTHCAPWLLLPELNSSHTNASKPSKHSISDSGSTAPCADSGHHTPPCQHGPLPKKQSRPVKTACGTTCKITEWVPHLEGWDPATLAALCSSGRLHHRCVLLTNIIKRGCCCCSTTKKCVWCCYETNTNKQEGQHTNESQQAVKGTGMRLSSPDVSRRSAAGSRNSPSGQDSSQPKKGPSLCRGPQHNQSSKHFSSTQNARFVAADRQRTQRDTQTVLYRTHKNGQYKLAILAHKHKTWLRPLCVITGSVSGSRNSPARACESTIR